MEEILKNIFVSLSSSIGISILSIIFFIKPYSKHRKMYAKIMKLSRIYRDSRNNGFLEPKIDFKQGDYIIEIIDDLHKQRDLHHFFSFLFDYDKIIFNMKFLFDYTRDPIMLPKDKKFEENYLMDTNKLFNTIKRKMNFQPRILIFFIILLIILSLIVFLIF